MEDRVKVGDSLNARFLFVSQVSIERKDGTGEKRVAITRLISTRNRERRWRQVSSPPFGLIIESLERSRLFVRNSWFARISWKPVAP